MCACLHSSPACCWRALQAAALWAAPRAQRPSSWPLLSPLPLQVLDGAGIKDPFIRNWLDLLSFLLSGLPADATIAAEVAFMFNEW